MSRFPTRTRGLSRHGRAAACLAASALLHLLVLWLATAEQRPARSLAMRLAPRRPLLARRFAVPQSRRHPGPAGWRVPTARTPSAPGLTAPELVASEPLELPPVAAPDSTGPLWGHTPRRATPGAAPPVAMPAPATLPPVASGLPRVGPPLLEDEAEKRTWAVVDPATGKLRRARLFLPAEGACGRVSRAHILDDLLLGMGKGQAAARDLPVTYQVLATPCGQALKAAQLRRYRVILTDFVNVASDSILAAHLADGGFALTSVWQLQRLYTVLRTGSHRIVRRVELRPKHVLFSAFYDIDAYTFEHMEGVPYPLPGLEVDGRLVAVGGLRYRVEKTSSYTAGGAVGSPAAAKPHLSNLLFVNALAYGLIQPGPMGGVYLDARGEATADPAVPQQ